MYKDYRSRAPKPNQLNPRFPNRKPTEGEIEQFIELIKNSNANNQTVEESNKKQINYQYEDYDMRTKVPLNERKHQGGLSKYPASGSNSEVIFKKDGFSMKTNLVQSPESYIKEAERFEEGLHEERTDKSNSDYYYSQSCYDPLRKTTYQNKNSELKVTISREQEKSYYNKDIDGRRTMISGTDVDERYLCQDTNYSSSSRTKSSETYSRSYQESSAYQRESGRYPEAESGYSSYSRQSSFPQDTDLRVPPSKSPPLNSQRGTYPGDLRNPRDKSPTYYSEKSSMRLRENSPTYRSSYYGSSGYGTSSHGKVYSPTTKFQWKRTPSPPVPYKRRAITSKIALSEDSFSDYDTGRYTPEIKDRRDDRRLDVRHSPTAPLSPPSPPLPPVLSDMKKMSMHRPMEYERSMMNKNDPSKIFSELLADRNVSISELLQAAIGPTAYSS